MMRQIKKGATDQSVVVRVIDATDGTPEQAVKHNTTGVALWYRREGAAKTAISAVALAALSDAHSDGGWEHIDDGYYRLDVPDAAFATGTHGVMIGGAFDNMVVIGCYVPLVDFDPQDATRLGLTALPNAAAEAAGGLFTRGTGAGQIAQDANGRIDTVHRKWKPTARDLARLFPDRLHATVARLAMEKPYTEVEVRHVVIPADQYGEGAVAEPRRRTPYMSIYIDVENQHVLEEVGVFNPIYVIPRWQTVSGSPYAHSPATVAALPDARLIQAMTQALLDAGEKAASPPLLGVQEAIRSDIQVFAGGITWVDAEYDERLGEVLRPLTQDLRGLPIGVDMADRTRAMIAEAFFLNKLTMPSAGGPEMTAFEVGQRVQEYIRQAMPIFEPMEAEYNGALCETTFDLLLRAGALGSPNDIPPSLRGMEVQFHFESPLHDATERQKSQRFMEGRAILAQALELDPGAASMIDARTALRDVLTGIGIPAAWTRDDKAMAEIEAAAQKQQQAAAMLAEVQQTAQAAEQVGRAGESLKQSGALQGAQAIGEALGQGTP